LYLDRTGCAWRYLPADFPPWQTVYGYFAAWRDDGTLARLHDVLRTRVRVAAGRKPQPTAAVIDSQSFRAADTVPKATRGWDNAKKVNGRKRHIAVDTTGLVLDVVITAASVQDRDAARPLLWNTHRACRRVRLVWADAGYTGKLATWAATLKMTLQIVAKHDPHAFEILPRRWVVERTLCAARRSVVFPVQPGGIRREVPGSNGLPGSERLRGQQHARKPGGRVQWSGTARRGDPRDMAKAGLPEA
jgi:putative transposase